MQHRQRKPYSAIGAIIAKRIQNGTCGSTVLELTARKCRVIRPLRIEKAQRVTRHAPAVGQNPAGSTVPPADTELSRPYLARIMPDIAIIQTVIV